MKIEFACKNLNPDDIIMCSFNLTKTEFRIFEYLVKNGGKWFNTNEISLALDIGLSTAQKGVKKLCDGKIVRQSQKNIPGGGYFFVYRIINKPELRKIILTIIRKWVHNVESEINNW